MDNRPFNILQVIPPLDLNNANERDRKIEEVKEFLGNLGRTSCGADEMCFMLLLDNYINALSKAKTMLGRNRFTVQYTKHGSSDTPDLGDFNIIPIVNISDQQQRN